MFAGGQKVTLMTDNGQRFVLTIDRPFTPFTKSVVVLARCLDLSPEPVIVKIYDPRFLDERMMPPWSRPWTLAAERAAPTEFDMDTMREDDPPADDATGQLTRASLLEAYFRSLLVDCFESERDAYARLQHLQGSAIPRLIAKGLLVPPDERAFIPPVLVLEYVQGSLLANTPVQELTTELCTALVSTIDSFAAVGVSHNDITPSNVIIAPERAVVIDFGCAASRRLDQDDESWSLNLNYGNDGGCIRFHLRQKGVTGMDDILNYNPIREVFSTTVLQPASRT